MSRNNAPSHDKRLTNTHMLDKAKRIKTEVATNRYVTRRVDIKLKKSSRIASKRMLTKSWKVKTTLT